MHTLKNILKIQIIWFLSLCLIFTLSGLTILPVRVSELKSARAVDVSDQINNLPSRLPVSAEPLSFFGLLPKTLALQPAENPDQLAVSGYSLQSGAILEQLASINTALIPAGVIKGNKAKQLVLEVLPLSRKASFVDLNLASFFPPVNWAAGSIPDYAPALSVLGAVVWFGAKRFKDRTVIFLSSDVGGGISMFNRLVKPKTAIMRC